MRKLLIIFLFITISLSSLAQNSYDDFLVDKIWATSAKSITGKIDTLVFTNYKNYSTFSVNGIDDAGFILSAQGIYQTMTKGVRCDLSPDQIKW